MAYLRCAFVACVIVPKVGPGSGLHDTPLDTLVGTIELLLALPVGEAAVLASIWVVRRTPSLRLMVEEPACHPACVVPYATVECTQSAPQPAPLQTDPNSVRVALRRVDGSPRCRIGQQPDRRLQSGLLARCDAVLRATMRTRRSLSTSPSKKETSSSACF